MTEFLNVERLKTFSDSVLLVAITILAYNLVPPPILNGQLNDVEEQSFLDNFYGLVSSFSMISVFWVLYTKVLDYTKEVDEIVIFTSLVFFILVLLVPVFSLAQFQYENLQSVVSLAVLQITNGLLLILLWTYLLRYRDRLMVQEELSTYIKKCMYRRLALIPCLYIITIAIGLIISIQAAIIFPVVIIPAMILQGRVFCSETKKNSTNL